MQRSLTQIARELSHASLMIQVGLRKMGNPDATWPARFRSNRLLAMAGRMMSRHVAFMFLALMGVITHGRM
jgi:hypothetical protein